MTGQAEARSRIPKPALPAPAKNPNAPTFLSGQKAKLSPQVFFMSRISSSWSPGAFWTSLCSAYHGERDRSVETSRQKCWKQAQHTTSGLTIPQRVPQSVFNDPEDETSAARPRRCFCSIREVTPSARGLEVRRERTLLDIRVDERLIEELVRDAVLPGEV